MLFKYNLKSIKRQDFIMNYIQLYGYENLLHLLKSIK